MMSGRVPWMVIWVVVLVALAGGGALADANWEMVLTGGVGNVETVSFIDANHGLVGGSGGKGMFGSGEDVPPMAYTRDGGKSWKPVWLDRPTIKGVSCVQLITPTAGVAIGRDSEGTYLLQTMDGGQRWTSLLLPTEVRATTLHFLTPTDGWVFCPSVAPKQAHLQVTHNSGRSWTPISVGKTLPAPGWRPLIFYPISRDEFYLCGNFDYLLHTVDGGSTFTTLPITYRDSRDRLSALGFSIAPDGKTMYLVGGQASEYLLGGWRAPQQAVMVKSADGGKSWETLHPKVVNLLRCVKAVSATEVWAGGFGGYGLEPWVPGVLLHSRDGGQSWVNASPSQLSIRAMAFLRPDLFWAVGGQGGSPHETAGAILCYRPEPEGERPTGHLPIRYSMPADGYASLVVKDARGQQVRTLLAHARRKAGAQVDWWDGLDDDGLPVPAGAYSWKLLTHRGITATYLMSYNSPNDPPYVTPDGKGGWIGDHGAPMAVAAAGEKMIIGFGAGESLPAIALVDLAGQKTGVNGKGWPVALATDGTYGYTISEGFADTTKKDAPQAAMVTTLTRWELATGRYAYFEQQQATRPVSTWTLDQSTPEKFLSERIRDNDFPAEFSDHTCNNVHVRTTNACGLACGDGKIFISLRKEDTIRILDAASCRPVGDVRVPSPVGLAYAKGVLYVVSEQRVLRFADLTQPGTVLIEKLAAPFALTVHGDRLYVADWGAAMQVKVFTLEGRPVATIGKPGGRPWLGTYDPTGMLKPRGLAVDQRGRLWVAEDDEPLKRVSIWNPDGTLAQELIGAGRYAAYSFMYPEDLSTAYVNTYGVTSFTIDLATKRWQPQAVLSRDGYDPKQLTGVLPFFTAKAPDGRTLYLTSTRAKSLGIAEMRDQRLQPIVAVGWAPLLVPPDLQRGWNQPFNPVTRKQRTDYQRHKAYYDEHGGQVCLWIDANRDGLYQPDELQYVTLPGWDTSGAGHNPPGTSAWGQWIGPDLTLYLVTNWVPGQIWRWPLAGWDARGLPIYRPDDLKLLYTMPTQATGAITVGPSGTVVMQGNLSAVNAQGQPCWRYPKHWGGMAFQAPFGKPGLVVGTQAFCGWVDDLVMVSGYFGQFNVLTEDGLYVAQFLNDGRANANAGADSVNVENFSGLWLRDPRTKHVYLVVGGAGDSRIFRIDGLETIWRASGTCTVTPADVTKARAAARAHTPPPAAVAKQAVITRTMKALTMPGELDNDWKALAPIVDVKDSQRTGYTVRAAHDGINLYLAYQVFDTSPMVNAGDDFRQLFKTGDVVDFLCGPAAPHTQPMAGDLRLLMSSLDGKPTAVLYRPVKLPGQDPAPAGFSSPSRTLTMERVTQEPGVELQIVRRDSFYLLKAKIPLALLGVAYQPGVRIAADFGVVYSDQLGSRNIFRSYWASLDPTIAIVNDIPSEAAINPRGWAAVTLE